MRWSYYWGILIKKVVSLWKLSNCCSDFIYIYWYFRLFQNLRDTYTQAESKLKSMEEEVEDANSYMASLDTSYKE